jgi:hypothetical protein
MSSRSDKYTAKFDPTVIQSRYTATKAMAIAKSAVHQDAMAIKATAVQAILNEAGIIPIERMAYQAFSNKLYGICNKFGGATAIAQAKLELERWVTGYSKDVNVCKSIWAIYSAVLGTAPSPI